MEEIGELRARLHPTGERWQCIQPQHAQLAAFTEVALTRPSDLGPHAQALGNHMYVLAVAMHQTLYRLLLRDIVDRLPTARARLSKLRDLRFDASDLVAIHDERLSLGELVAHLVPLKDFGRAAEVFSILLDQDYIERVSTADFFAELPASMRAKMKAGSRPVTLRGQGLDTRALRDIAELFRLRHIIAHEISAGLSSLPLAETGRLINSANALLLVMVTDASVLLGETPAWREADPGA